MFPALIRLLTRPTRRARRRAVVEECEARVLYSADLNPALWAGGAAPAEVRLVTPEASAPAASPSQPQEQAQQRRHEIVFVDAAVPDAQVLIDGVLASRGPNAQIEIVQIGAGADGLKQISDALAGERDLNAIHIISHGDAGRLQLGSAVVDTQALNNRAGQLEAWRASLTPQADILLYGCDVAQGAVGQHFVELLAQLTDADVAASTDVTGSAARGGNWVLEDHVGSIETPIAIGAAAQAQWTGLLATYTVVNTNNAGAGSLRQAIIDANANAGADSIGFNIAAAGVQTISLTAALPQITGQVTLDATTQPGFVGTPLIRIDGASAGAGADGLVFTASSDASTVRGVMITRFANDGIVVQSGADNVVIVGNWIGTAGTGTTGVGNTNTGIESFAVGTRIGGTGTFDGNVITNSGNDGISLAGGGVTGYVLQGNIIGLDPDGATGGGNVDVGLALLTGSGNTIGGSTAAARNVISKNYEGIEINTSNNVVQGNYIGTDASGTLNRGNRIGDGVQLQGGSTNNLIGGTAAGAGNLIAFNALAGVDVVNGSGDAVLGNLIRSNAGLGIDLGPTGVTANDNKDPDTGANDLQNFPLLTSASANAAGTTIVGTLNSNPGTTFRIEFFGNRPSVADASNGEGERYLGFITVTTAGGNGNAAFNATLANVWVNAGDRISATATVDLGGGNYGSTSEFAANITATSTGIVVVDTVSDVSDGTTTSIGTLGNARGADGRISLREAISATNNTANGGTPDKIVFDIPAALVGGAHTINMTSELPTITEALIVDGSSEPDFAAAGNPVVVLNGSGAGAGANGLTITSGGSTVKGLVINGFNGYAISLQSGAGNLVTGNFIGTNAAGMAASANSWGIVIGNATNNTIGGTTPAERNVISGNTNDGINFLTTAATGNLVQGNFIGTNAAGTLALGNGGYGIGIGSSNNTIGGTAAGAGNLISGNGSVGIGIQTGTGNPILGNSIYANAGIGIDLNEDGVTANDVGDADTGANNLQNFPLLATARTDGAGQLILTGTLNSNASSYYRIEFFASTVQDGSGYGEGQRYLGFVNVASNGSGNATISTTLTATVAAGEFISATATKSNAGFSAFTDTSEFARNVAAVSSTQAVIIVDTTSDTADGDTTSISTLLANKGADGFVSLREAIIAANNTANGVTPDNISFDIAAGDAGFTGTAGVDGRWVIALGSALPSLTDAVVLDGTSQTLLRGDTNPGLLGSGGTVGADRLVLSQVARPEIEIVGTRAMAAGFDIASSNVTVRGFAMRGFGSTDATGAIVVEAGASNALIESNVLGSAAVALVNPVAAEQNNSGIVALGNSGIIRQNVIDFSSRQGIRLETGSNGWLVEGNEVRDTGINNSNGDGIAVGGTASTIRGNLVAGTSTQGLVFYGTPGGIVVQNNTVSGNGMGTTSTAPSESSGIAVRSGGSAITFDRNTIISNYGAGVQINNGATGIALTANEFFGNGTVTSRNGTAATGQIAIDLNSAADNINLGSAPFVTANDAGDADTGANNLQNFPVLTSAHVDSSTQLTVVGTLNSTASSFFRVEFFSNAVADGSGYGEGQTYLGFVNVTTNASGNVGFNTPLTASVAVGSFVSATATKSNAAFTAFTDTSEFAQNAVAANAAPTATNLNATETYTEDTALNLIDIVVSDVDSANVTATLTLSNAAAGALNTGTSNGVTSTYNAGTGVWAASGVIAGVNTLLAGLTFTPSLNFNANFTIATSVSDGLAAPITGNKAITGTPVNDAPVLGYTGAIGLPGTDENTTSSPTLVSDILVSAAQTDVDSGALSGIAVTSVIANGSFQYSTDGVTWSNFGSVSGSNALLLTSTSRVRYVPDGNNGEFASFNFKAWDRTSGTASTNGAPQYANPGAGGGSTAYSAETGLVQQAVTVVNDAPVLSPIAPSLTSITEDQTANAGQSVASIVGGSISDVDSGAVQGIAINALTSGNGGWQYSIDNRVTWTAIGAVNNTSALLLRGSDFVRFVPDAMNATSASFGYRAWDQTTGAAGSKVDSSINGGSSAFSTATDTASITVTAVNDAPVLTPIAPTLTSITEDQIANAGQTVASIVGGSVSDVDSGAVQGIAINALASGNGGWQYSTDGGGTWTAIGAVNNTSALLLRASDFVRFVPDAMNATSASFGYRAWDQTTGAAGSKVDSLTNGGSSAFSTTTDTASITVTAVNDAPVLTPIAPTLTTITEDQTANTGQTVASIIGGSISDVDSGAVQGIAINALASGNGAWQYSIDNRVTWTAIGAVNNTSALLLRGSDFVRFVPDAMNATSASLTYRAWDQTSGAAGAKVDSSTNGGTTAFSTATDTASITVTAVNDAPTATNLSAAETYTEDTALNLTDIVVSDVDSANVTATLTLSNIAAGSLNAGTSGAVTSTYNAGTGVWTASGAIADVNTLLAALTFTPALNFNSNFTIATSVSDGVAAPITGSKVITGTAVNDAPTATNLSAAETYTEDTALNLTDIVVSDVDSANVTATLTLSNIAAGSLNSGTSNGVTSTYNAGTGVWSASGAITDVNTLLAALTFTPSLNFNSNFTIATSVSDGVAAPITGSKVITGTAVNDAPTATNLSAAETYTEDTALNLTDIVVSDVDSANVTATLTLSNIAAGSLNSGTSNGVTSTYNAGTGVWSASGAITDVNTLLAALTFTPSLNFNSNFTIATSVSDGVAAPITGSKVITGTAVNDAPVLSPIAPTLASITEDQTANTGQTVASIIGGSISDVDSGAVQGIAINALASGNGAWQYSTDGGGTWSAIGAVTDTSALLLRASDFVRFVPDAMNATSASFGYRAWDQTTGAAGSKVDSSINGGSSAFSTATDTASITVTAVNDAPVLTPIAPTLASITEDQIANTGQTVASIIGGSISDVDSGAVQGIAINALTSGNGAWQYSTDGGGTWSAIGAVNNTSALLLRASDFVRFVPDAMNATSASFGYRAWDQTTGAAGSKVDSSINGGASAFSTTTDTASITVTAVNDAPVLTPIAPALNPITEDQIANTGQTVASIIGGSISDVDSGAVQGIAINALASGNGGWQYSTDGGGTWSAIGAVTDTSALLLRSGDFVRFVPDAMNATSASFGYRAWDQTTGAAGSKVDSSINGGTSAFSTATDTASITVTAVNDAPVLTPIAPTLTSITEDQIANAGQTVASIVGSSISDVDSGAVQGIAINALASGNGTWQYSTDGGGTWSAIGAVTDTSALLLRSGDFVRFVPDAMNATSASFSFRAWDQTSGSAGSKVDSSANGASTAYSAVTDTASISVSAVNDAPVLAGANNLASMNEDAASNAGTLVSALIAGQVSDVDSAALRGVAVTAVDNSNGAWQYSTDAGASWTAFGTPSATTARLLATDANSWVRFVPNANWNGSVTNGLSLRAWDQSSGTAGGTADASSNGGSTAFSSATFSSAITVTAVNDAPVNTMPAAQAVNEDATLVFSAANGNAISVSDVDAGASALQVTLTVTNGVLTLGGTAGLSFTGGANGSAAMTFTGTISAINTALNGLVFAPAANFNGAAVLSLVSNDQGNTGSGGALSDSDSVGITVGAVNDAPAVTTTGTTLAFTENGAATAVDANLSVSDIDSVNLNSATVSIAAGYASGEDTLAFTNQAGITGSWNVATGVLTLTGNASVAQYQTALRSITYLNSSDSPSTVTRTVAFVVNDGVANSNTGTRSISVAAVNDAPVLNGANNLAPINEGAASNPGTLVSALIAGQVSDVDSGALSGIAVTAVDNSNGAWQYSTDAGASWTAFGTPGASTARLLASDANTCVRFVPNANWNGSVTNGLTWRAWDQTSGTAGGTADTSSNGGSTAFSGAAFSSSITVNPVNDAPVLTPAAPTLNPITEDQTANAGQTVAAVVGASISDLDSGALQGIAINALASGNGAWQYSTDGGATWTAIGAVSNTSALLLRASDHVRFVPDALNATSASFGYRAWDQTSGAAGSRVDSSTNGGSTAFSTATDTASISVAAVNDAPVLDNSGAMLLTTLDEDQINNTGNTVASIIASAGGDRITDVDSGALEGIAVSGTSGGTWQYSIDGATSWAGVGAVSDSSALLLRASDRLRFVPDGQNGTAGSLTLRAWDQSTGAAGSKLDASTNGGSTAFSAATETASISVTAVNDAPLNTVPAAQVVGEDTALVFSAANGNAISVGDVDAANSALQVTLTVTNGVLTLGGTAGITLTGGADGSASLTFTGTLVSINAALNGLAFAPGANFNGAAVLSIVTDDLGNSGAGGAMSDTDSVAITVVAVNDAPTTSPVTLASIAEDSGARLITQAELLSNAVDIDGPSLTATGLTIASGGGSLIDNGNGTWSYASALNDDTVVSFSYVVTDGSLTAAGSTTLDLTPVNDAPTTSSVTLTPIAEDSGARLITQAELLSNAADIDGPSLTATGLTIASGSGSLIDNGNGTWTYTAALNDDTVVSFSYVVTDGSLTAAGNATLDIAPVNDAPSTSAVTLTPIAEDSGARLITQAELLSNAADIDGPSLTATGLTIASGSGTLIDNGNGTWTYTSALNDDSSVSFSYTVTDGSLTAAGNATLDLTPVNDAPTTSAVTLLPIAEDSGARLITQAELLSNAADVDGPSLTATGLTIASGSGTLIDNGNGTWTYTSALNDDSAVSFSYTVTDGSLTAAGSAALDITPVNDAPVISSNGGGAGVSLVVAENTAPDSTLTTLVATDADQPASALRYAISGGADAARFSVDAMTGAVRFVTTPDFEAPTDAGADNVYEVTVQASDGALFAQQQLRVTVVNVNEAPSVFAAGAATLGGNAAGGTWVATATASDPDAGDSQVFSLANDAGGRFVIDAASGRIEVAPGTVFDIHATSVFDLRIRVTDAAGLQTERALRVNLGAGEADADPVVPLPPLPPLLPPLPSLFDGGAGYSGQNAALHPLPEWLEAPPALPAQRPPAGIDSAAHPANTDRPGTASIAPAAADKATDGAATNARFATAPADPPRTRPPAIRSHHGDSAEEASLDASSIALASLASLASPTFDASGLAADASGTGAWAELTGSTTAALRAAGLGRRGDAIEVAPGGAAAADAAPQAPATFRDFLPSPAQLTGAGFSAGFIWWLTRSGGLLTSMLMGVPAWRHIDLLPVLARNLDEDDEDDDAAAAADATPDPSHTPEEESETARAARIEADMAIAALFERRANAPHGARPPS